MQNMQKPFFVWTESTTPKQHKSLKDHGCYNFLTGTGGFIQSVVYGYGGIRFKKGLLEMQPQLPPNATHFKLRGINYASVGQLSLALNETVVEICLSSKQGGTDTGFIVGVSTEDKWWQLVNVGSCLYFSAKNDTADSISPTKFIIKKK